MKRDLVSVIVPVYNVEKYLSECLDSILKQTYKNLDIILVDDGSTDSSGKICDEYKNRDSRIRVFHKENGGLSDARNAGISVANGNYITFIDSDDIVGDRYVEFLYNSIIKGKSDISVCRFKRFSNKDSIAYDNTEKEENSIDSKEYYIKTLYQFDHTIYSVSSCAKLYKKEIFKNNRFDVGRINEDFLICDRVLKEAKTVSLIDSTQYFYRINNSSITNSKFNKKRLYILEYCDFLKDKYKNDKQICDAIDSTIYTRSIEFLTLMIESKFHDKNIKKTLWLNIKQGRKKVLKNKETRKQIKISALLSFLGPTFLGNINVLLRKFKKKTNIQ